MRRAFLRAFRFLTVLSLIFGQEAIADDESFEGLFSSTINIVGPDDAAGITSGDFNGDGVLDIATASEGSDYVSVITGNGNGTFSQATIYNVGDQPRKISSADINGDGLADLLTANFLSDTCSILLAVGDGTFVAQQAIAVQSQPTDFTVGDFNSDGHADVITVGTNSAFATVWFGEGSGSFVDRLDVNTYEGQFVSNSSIASGDVNNDGFLDFVINRNTSFENVATFLGNGDGSFQPPILATTDSFEQLKLIDVDSDGQLDIFALKIFSRLGLLFGAGDGTFAPAQYFPAGNSPLMFSVADMNLDENYDVAVVQGSSSISILEGFSGVTFIPGVEIDVPGLTSVELADFNADGLVDLAGAVGNRVLVFYGNGDFTFQSEREIEIGGGGARRIAHADFNNDGLSDLVVSSDFNDEIVVLLGIGDARFSEGQAYPVGSNPFALVPADYDGDGNVDLAVTAGGAVSVLFGVGDGTLTGAQTVNLPISASTLISADINQDDNPDLIHTDYFSDAVSIAIGNGDGMFQETFELAVGDMPFHSRVADVNNDGFADIVTSNAGSFDVSVQLGIGGGGFETQSRLAVGAQPTKIRLIDANNDSNLDIVTSNANPSSISIMLGDGTGQFGKPNSLPLEIYPQALVVADFNSDGNVDLSVCGNETSIFVFAGLGDGTFSQEAAYVPEGKFLISGDFNQDNYPDLAVIGDDQSSRGDRVSLLLNNCVPSVTTLNPETLVAVHGVANGGVFDLATSDDADYSLVRASNDVVSRTTFEVTATSPVPEPTSLEVRLEGSVFARTSVIQSIDLFDFGLNEWIEVDSRDASRFSDAEAVVPVTKDLERFIESKTRTIKARVRYRSTNARQKFTSNTDRFSWFVE